ncbi:unnamed protein product [Meganyctiphanes norvegica]|uniref:Peptidylprolyl isomerase n=1 Tax=Meganyctiphanes norvegica TaxID=48144 RepID=A0AAV2SWM9_MEGNR
MLKQGVKETKMYATKKIGNTKYFSSIKQRKGSIILNSLQQNLSLDTDSSVFEYDNVMRLAADPPVVFLKLTYGRKNLGFLHICLDGLPRHAQQFMELATGSSSRGSYINARFDKRIYEKGKPGEYVCCHGFINAAGATDTASICQVEDCETIETPVTEGIVFGWSGQCSGFWIFTKSSSTPWGKPVIGHVISGMSQLKAAIKKYVANNIVFTECGVILSSSV